MNASAVTAELKTEFHVELFLRAKIMHRALDLASAVATHLDAVARRPRMQARRSVGQHTVLSLPPFLAAPHACLAWRLRDFATNRHE